MPISRELLLRHCFFYREKVMNIQRFKLWFKLLLLSPTIIWFALFNMSKYIPNWARPEVDTTTLPYLDSRMLLGHSLLHFPRNVMEHNSSLSGLVSFFDLLSAFVYVIHFCFAWIFAFGIYLYFRKKTDLNGKPFINPWTFLYCLGLLNLFSVIVQLCWPTAPPWYVELYGTKTPSYNTKGDPAGLANADAILGIKLFAGIYGNSPIVFGSFPSLHGAWPCMIALFTPPGLKFKVAAITYVSTVWWAAMYLNHHYLTDLLGGLLIVIGVYMFGLLTVDYLVSHFKDSIYGKAHTRLVRYNPSAGIAENADDLELVVDESAISPPQRATKMKKAPSRDDNVSLPLLDDDSFKRIDTSGTLHSKTDKSL